MNDMKMMMDVMRDARMMEGNEMGVRGETPEKMGEALYCIIATTLASETPLS